MLESCSSSQGTITALELYLKGFSTTWPNAGSAVVVMAPPSATISPVLDVSSVVGIGSGAPVAVVRTVDTARTRPYHFIASQYARIISSGIVFWPCVAV